MSTMLFCNLKLHNAGKPRYWWPLYFEAMRRVAFSFSSPLYVPEHRGNYYCWSSTDSDDVVAEGASFAALWRDINTLTSPVLVEFWSTERDSYLVQAVVRGPELQPELSLSLPGQSLSPDQHGRSVQEVWRLRIGRFLQGIRELHALCGPAQGDIGWERSGELTMVGAIGKPFEYQAPSEQIEALGHHETWSTVQLALAGGSVLSTLDPFPVPSKSGWMKLALPDPLIQK